MDAIIIILVSILIGFLLGVFLYTLYRRHQTLTLRKQRRLKSEFDIVDFYSGVNKTYHTRKGRSGSFDRHPSIDFFVPELPAIYQQHETSTAGIVSTYYQTGTFDDDLAEVSDASSDTTAAGDTFGSAPFLPKVTRSNSLQRRKSSLRRLISTTAATDFDVSIYQGDADMELCGLTTIKSCGRLHLSVVHDVITESVIVNVLHAACLRQPSKRAGKAAKAPDTCVKVRLTDANGRLSGRTLCSRVFAGNFDPQYNSSFFLETKDIQENAGGKVRKKSKSRTRKARKEEKKANRTLGCAVALSLSMATFGTSSTSLNTIEDLPREFDNNNKSLSHQDDKLVLEVIVFAVDRFSRQEELGLVTIDLREVSLYAGVGRELDVWRDLLPRHAEVMPQGELSVSLCYTPTDGSLSISVLRARELVPPPPETPPVFPEIERELGELYVKVTMLKDGTVVKRRRSSMQVQSTTPDFNDVYVFNVTPEVMGAVTVAFTVFLRNSRGQRVMLGKMNVGGASYCVNSGFLHWEETFRSPGVTVMHWHNLY